MYKFKHIKAEYQFRSETTDTLGERSTYAATYPISSLLNLVEGLNFTLRGAEDETLDGRPLDDFDLLMSQIGHLLYPVELNVLRNGQIKCLRNYGDIKLRWENGRKDLLSTYSNSYWVERYINMASKRLVAEETFMKAFMRHSFVQLLFMEEGTQRQAYCLYDFPLKGNEINVPLELVEAAYGEYHYHSVPGGMAPPLLSGDGELRLEYSEKGQPLAVSFYYEVEVRDEGLYSKRINIGLIENK
jgi:hypothetical protein